MSDPLSHTTTPSTGDNWKFRLWLQLLVVAGIIFMGWTSVRRERHLVEVCKQAMQEDGQYCIETLRKLGDTCIEHMKRCGCTNQRHTVRFLP